MGKLDEDGSDIDFEEWERRDEEHALPPAGVAGAALPSERTANATLDTANP